MKRLALITAISLLLLGCVRTPTQDTKIVDDRPRVSFDTSELQQTADDYRLRVDGIDYGSVAQYLRDKNALPLLSGQHLIEVLRGSEVVFEKKLYLGENSSRVITVVPYE